MIGFYIAVKFLVLWLTTVQGEIQGQGFLYRLEVLSSLDSVFVSSEETRAEFSPAKISILFQCNWGLKNGKHCLSLRSLVSRFVARSLVSRFVARSPASCFAIRSLAPRFAGRSSDSRFAIRFRSLASRLGLRPFASRLGLRPLASRLGLRPLVCLWQLKSGEKRAVFFMHWFRTGILNAHPVFDGE